MSSNNDEENKKNIRYEKAKEYWENCEPTIHDMLGGNPEVNEIDLKVSRKLIENLIESKKLNLTNVIDCGAGIGRVTDLVLKDYFSEIDLVEMNPEFVKYAKDFFKNNLKIKNIFCSPLQKFIFTKKYNCIWIQWCLENLEDNDLNIFLKNCYNYLEKDGLVIIKENIVDKGYYLCDQDYSKIRSDKIFKNLFESNKFLIFKHIHHPYWPLDLMKVSIFVLSKRI